MALSAQAHAEVLAYPQTRSLSDATRREISAQGLKGQSTLTPEETAILNSAVYTPEVGGSVLSRLGNNLGDIVSHAGPIIAFGGGMLAAPAAGAAGAAASSAPAWGEISATGIGGGATAGLGEAGAGLGLQTAGGYGTGLTDVPVQGISYGDPGFVDTMGLGGEPAGGGGIGLTEGGAGAGTAAAAGGGGGGAATGAVDPGVIAGYETGGSQAAAQAAQASSLLPATGGAGSALNAIGTGAKVVSAATGLLGLGAGASAGGLGGGSQTTTTSSAPASSAEQMLINLQTQLSQKQLDAINMMTPYNQELINQSLAQLQSQGKYQAALDAAISPQDQAAAQAAAFKQSASNQSMQQQLLQMQMDSLKQGGAATDAQKQQIAGATDAAIAAGTGDINTQTQRGIGMIADELANSRGMRLSDSPIFDEAQLVTRAGDDQAASLIKNLRASQATATLNYPLAVQQLNSGINSNQQQTLTAAQQFQDQLRQQAATNRLALTGPTNQAGLGLSGIGNTAQGIAATNLGRSTTNATTSSLGLGATLSGLGSLFGAPAGGTSAAEGIGNAISGWFS